MRIAKFLLIAATIMACGCSPHAKPTPKDGTGAGKTGDGSTNTLELPLPNVPADMHNPEERAAYILSHFWDSMQFNDAALSHNRAFMERNFVNFVSLFPHAPEAQVAQSIARLWQLSSSDKAAFNMLADIAEHYLSDPNSPMRNENHFILFLEEMLRSPHLSAEERLRPASLLAMARKNRPETVAANFAYTTPDGTSHTLRNTRAPMLLLLFYDPACSHCGEILARLQHSELLNTLSTSRKLSILAIYTEGDRNLWNDTKMQMPANWTVGFDETRIFDNRLYDLPAMPVIYLLDSKKTVLLKDPTPDELMEYLDPTPHNN